MTDRPAGLSNQTESDAELHPEGEASPARTEKISSTLLNSIGAVLLVIGALCWTISLFSIHGFSEDKTTSVKEDKSYYILADKDALEANACGFFGPGGQAVNDKVKEVEDLTNGDSTIKDISLPFSSSKGTYARVQFSEDIEGAHILCNVGKNYISTKSFGTLNALRWISMVGVGTGIALLIAGAVFRSRSSAQHSATEELVAEED